MLKFFGKLLVRAMKVIQVENTFNRVCVKLCFLEMLKIFMSEGSQKYLSGRDFS